MDFDKVAAEHEETFQVEQLSRSFDEKESNVHKHEGEKLKVLADLLGSLLSPYRAVLNQREPAKFSANDMKLREKMLKRYPRITASFFLWHFVKEPKFLVANETND